MQYWPSKLKNKLKYNSGSDEMIKAMYLVGWNLYPEAENPRQDVETDELDGNRNWISVESLVMNVESKWRHGGR